MIEFEIHNYKTIKHIPRTTIDGYVTLQGEGFIGKSALAQAIRAAWTNPKGNDFIRHGESFARVTLWHNGHVIDWTKGRDESASYIIDGIEFSKVGAGSIPQALTDLGYGPLLVGSEKVDLLYAPQLDPLFLIDKANTNFTTDILSAIYKIDIVYKAVQNLNADTKKNADLLKLRQADKLIADEGLSKVSDTSEINLELDRLQALEDLIKAEGVTKTFLDQSQAELLSLGSKIATLDPVTTLQVLKAPDLNTSELEMLEQSLAQLQVLKASLQKTRAIESMSVPTVNIDQKDITDLEEISALREALRAALLKVRASTAVASLAIPEAPAVNTVELEELRTLSSGLAVAQDLAAKEMPTYVGTIPDIDTQEVDFLIDAQARLVELNKKLGTIMPSTVLPLPVVEDLSALEALQKQLGDELLAVNTVETLIVDNTKAIGEIEQELSLFTECPTCGKGLDHVH